MITLFIKTSLSWLIFESIKALEIKTSMLLNLDFVKNTILSIFFLFFLIIHLYVLIPVFISQILNPISELVILIEVPTKEAKTEMEIHPVIVEITISECST